MKVLKVLSCVLVFIVATEATLGGIASTILRPFRLGLNQKEVNIEKDKSIDPEQLLLDNYIYQTNGFGYGSKNGRSIVPLLTDPNTYLSSDAVEVEIEDEPVEVEVEVEKAVEPSGLRSLGLGIAKRVVNALSNLAPFNINIGGSNDQEVDVEDIVVSEHLPLQAEHIEEEVHLEQPVHLPQQVHYSHPINLEKQFHVPQPYHVQQPIHLEQPIHHVQQPIQHIQPIQYIIQREPYAVPVTRTIGIPQPYPVTNTIIKEIHAPAVVKEAPVQVQQPIPIKVLIQGQPVSVPVSQTVNVPIHHFQQPYPHPIINEHPIISEHPISHTIVNEQPAITLETPVSDTAEVAEQNDGEAFVEEEKTVDESADSFSGGDAATGSGNGFAEQSLPVAPSNEYGAPVGHVEWNSGDYWADTQPSGPIGVGEGDYVNKYVLSDGTKVYEEGKLVKTADGGEVLIKSGNYEFIDKTGKIIKTNWVADEHGFRVLN